MIYDTLVYVIVAKDKRGEVRGLEKVVDSKFYFTEVEAEYRLTEIAPEISDFYKVEPVIIRSAKEKEK